MKACASVDGLLELGSGADGLTSWTFAKGYEIRDAGRGKGLGVFARHSFAPGERIICEAPLVQWSSGDAVVRPGHDLRKLVAALPPEAQRAFFALEPVPLHSKSLVSQGIGATDIAGRVWMANAYPAREFEGGGGEGSSSAVYSEICRINHGCNPNCIHAWNELLQRQTVHATRPIAAGEELELTYLGTDRDAPGRRERQALLEDHFGFRCGCALCSLPDAQALRSDSRRARLVELCDLLHGERVGGGGTRPYGEVRALLEERLGLLRAEGVAEAFAHGAMLVVSAKAHEQGQRDEALGWARRALDGATLALGADSVPHRLYADWAAKLGAVRGVDAVLGDATSAALETSAAAAAAAARVASTRNAAAPAAATAVSHAPARATHADARAAAPPVLPMTSEQAEGAPIGVWPIELRRGTHGGRYVVATRTLHAGECVFCEEAPAVQTVHDNFEELVCHCCYAPLPSTAEDDGRTASASAPPPAGAAGRLGCGGCGGVWFCSPECASEMAYAHDGCECELVAQMRSAGVSGRAANLRLYLRLVQRVLADADAGAQIEQMHEHYDDCSDERRKALNAQADGLLELLPPSLRTDRERCARLIDRVHTNAFAVSDPAGVVRGTGLYVQAGSWFNHSCDPSAVVSFRGRALRVHTLREVAPGEEVSVAYVELYAARQARQAALREKKGFTCVCARCAAPPASDAPLAGWRCANAARGCAGCVQEGAEKCAACGEVHRLSASARAAVEARWKEGVDKWAAVLLGGASASPLRASARALLPDIEAFLRTETADRLCETHALRQRAFVLRSYAFAAAGAPPDCLVDAIECCLDGMDAHLDTAQPQVLFFRHRLSGALARYAQAEAASGNRAHAAELRARAREVGLAAVEGLALAYGADHPLVDEWRKEVESA